MPRPPRVPAAPRLAALACAVLALAPLAATAGEPAGPSAAFAAERAASAAPAALRAGAAHALGVTGAGVPVAVLDSGLNALHPEFAGRVAAGFDALGGGTVADRNGHGTHVAGILGAALDGRGVHGVAPGVRIVPVRVLDAGGHGSTAGLGAGLRFAVRERVAIANLSVGAGAPIAAAALREATDAGLLLVVAAGNRGAAHPDWPARFAPEAWAAGRILAVGAVDAGGTIAAFSNRAGDAREFFLVAPGVDIASTLGDGYGATSGTSMAAPAVAGAAALLKQAWPWLRAEQLAGVLLATATDLGAPGTDAVYGRGLVDVERALRPVGTLAVRAPDGTAAPASGAGLRTTAATAALAAAAAQGALRVAALDAFGRDFAVDLGAGVAAQPSPLSLERVFGRLGEQVTFARAVLADGLRLELASSDAAVPRADLAAVAPVAAAWAPSATPALRSLALSWTDGTIEVAAAGGALAGRAFGVQAMTVADVPLVAVPGLASPWLSLASGGTQLASGLTLGELTLRVGLLAAGGAISPVAPLPGWVDPARAQAAVLEASHRIGPARIAATLSATRETEALLGARASGALALSGGRTRAIELSAALPLAPRTALVGTVGVGATQGAGIAALAGSTDLVTRAFAIALVRTDVIAAGDRVALSVAQPMRASGEWSMTVPVGMSADGTMRYATRVLPMSPGGRELAGEASWWVPAGRERSVSLTLGVRSRPDHDAAAGTDALVALRWAGAF